MVAFTNLKASQKTIAAIAGVNPSLVSRYVTANKVMPLDTKSKENNYSYDSARSILSEIYTKDANVTKRTQCFYNFKGGTGKTSLCFQMASHLSLCGFSVLVVDADPQAHLSTLLGFDSMDNFLTLYDVIAEKISIRDAIKQVQEGLWCIPANLSLTKVMMPLDQMPKREEVIKNIFSEIEDEYDFIIFDTNPTISSLNRNIVVYSDVINIVCETQPLSINGLKILFEDLTYFFKMMHMKIPEIFVIPNKYEDRMGSSAEAMTALRKFYGQFLKPDFAVRKSEDLNTASRQGLPVSSFARRNSNALEDIVQLLREIIDRSTVQNSITKRKKISNG